MDACITRRLHLPLATTVSAENKHLVLLAAHERQARWATVPGPSMSSYWLVDVYYLAGVVHSKDEGLL
jgi:hypothetical protein